MPFDTPDALDRFVSEVRAALEARGFAIAARRLAELQGKAHTPEGVGELGAAVRAIQNQRGLPADLKDKLEVIRAEVRRLTPPESE